MQFIYTGNCGFDLDSTVYGTWIQEERADSREAVGARRVSKGQSVPYRPVGKAPKHHVHHILHHYIDLVLPASHPTLQQPKP